MNLILLSLLILLFSACGEPQVDFQQNNEPYIAISAFITPHKKVDGILLSKALALGQNFNKDTIYIKDANVELQELDKNGNIVKSQILSSRQKIFIDTLQVKNNKKDLQGNIFLADTTLYDTTFKWEYFDPTETFEVRYKTTYKLLVDYGEIHVSGKTTVPDSGFAILGTSTNQNSFVYALQNPILQWKSPNDSSSVRGYVLTLRARKHDKSNFIYQNIFSVFNDTTKLDSTEWRDFAEAMRNSHYTLDFDDGFSLSHQLIWFTVWFYTTYDVVVYACDENYFDYARVLTVGNQDPDGNFTEIKNHFEGNGIGVFAGVVSDTIQIKITKPVFP
ncbi:DUF4249 family protein [bacterium]|nr:DUF4249 family protein [bacterium]